MQRAIVESDLLVQPLVIIRAWHGVAEELGTPLVHRHQVLAMGLRPDFNELTVQRFQHPGALILQELNVMQRLVMVNVPVRMAHLERQQHVRICKHGVLVR
jgi:hypothetical protein